MNYFDQVKETLYQYKYLGEKILSTDVILIGKAPHIAPQAWLHCLFPPLSYKDVELLEREAQHNIPMPYKEFLLCFGNGISIFNAFNLYGLRKILSRTTDEAIWQPFSLDTPNTIERPKNAKDEYLFIGGYNWDGSLLYIDGMTCKVYYCLKRDATPLYEWNSFEEMLVGEVKRIQKHFDKEGRRIDKSVPTTPFVVNS
ncbi:MAG: / family protein [Flavipsychrobacter sp.]|nr:/ family protein [Flavipsychrobacter sp.]